MRPRGGRCAGASSTRSRSEPGMALLGRLGPFDRERLGASPGMLGDVEEHAFGAVELDFEPARSFAVVVHVVLAAQALDLLRDLLDVIDQDAEMVQSRVVETLA